MADKLFEEYFSSETRRRLDELTYKEISTAVDPNDLPYKDYVPLLKAVDFVAVQHNTMKFFVNSGRNGWDTYIRFPSWEEQVKDSRLSAPEAARLILWSDPGMAIHCGCPANLFWSAYIQTELGCAIVPETRYPSVRNPRLLGICCKHLRKTIKVLPFHLGNMAAAIKQQRQRLG